MTTLIGDIAWVVACFLSSLALVHLSDLFYDGWWYRR